MSDPVTGPIKRFYTDVAVADTLDGFAVTLDGRGLRTPAKAKLAAPTRALAQAIAGEWAGQGPHIAPETMPLTRIANVAIDRTPLTRADLAEGVARFAETDLLCHRADAPDRLADRQAQHWDPPLAWAGETMGVTLACAAGVIALNQPGEALERVRALALAQDDFRLTGLAHAAGVTGSAVLALAILHRAEPRGDALFQAVALDELWSLETWGGDAELEARVARTRADLVALETWFSNLAGA